MTNSSNSLLVRRYGMSSRFVGDQENQAMGLGKIQRFERLRNVVIERLGETDQGVVGAIFHNHSTQLFCGEWG